MTTPHRIKVYLDQHQVGPLFEDMMSKLISELPSDPVSFLVRILQSRMYQVPQTVMNVPQLRRSLGNLSQALEVEKLQIQRKPSSAVVRRNNRPLTPSVLTTPKKSVTICFPMRGGKTPNPDRSSVAKKVKAVSCGSPKPYNGETYSQENRVMKDDSGCVSFDTNAPRWRPGGYYGPIIPGTVFLEDSFKDEVIEYKQIEKNFKSDSCPKDSSPKIIDALLSKATRKANDEKSRQNMKLTQEESCESTEDNLQRYSIELNEELLMPKIVSGQHWNVSICSVCAKTMDSREFLNKISSFQSHEFPENPQVKQTSLDIPLLKIPHETSETFKEDLFASIRSLPLPKSPVESLHSKTKNWCDSSLESLYASANGWHM